MSDNGKLDEAAAQMRLMTHEQRVAIACAASAARSVYVNLGRADTYCANDKDRAEKVEQAWRSYRELGDWLRDTGVEPPQAQDAPSQDVRR